MPNPIKLNDVGVIAGAIGKQGVALGVNAQEYGPTATTGWYANSNPSSYYKIYEVFGPGEQPLIYSPANASELINFVKSRGINVGTESGALEWIWGEPNLFVTKVDYENIVTDGLVVNFDSGVASCYPTVGNAIFDLSGTSAIASLINGPTFNGQALVFDGVDDAIELAFNWTAADVTICAFMNPAVDCSNGDNNIVTIENSFEYKYNNLGNGQAYMQFASNPWAWYGNPGVTINLGQWQMLTFRHDSTSTNTGSIWSNDQRIFSQGIGGRLSAQNTNMKFMGRYCCNGSPAKGDLGTVLVYNRALSDTEISQNFEALRSRYGV